MSPYEQIVRSEGGCVLTLPKIEIAIRRNLVVEITLKKPSDLKRCFAPVSVETIAETKMVRGYWLDDPSISPDSKRDTVVDISISKISDIVLTVRKFR